MYKLGLGKAKELEIKLEIKLPTFIGSWWKQEIPKKKKKQNIYFCFIDYKKAFDSMDHNK